MATARERPHEMVDRSSQWGCRCRKAPAPSCLSRCRAAQRRRSGSLSDPRPTTYRDGSTLAGVILSAGEPKVRIELADGWHKFLGSGKKRDLLPDLLTQP